MEDSKVDNKYLTPTKKFILSSLLVIIVPFSILLIGQLKEQRSFSYVIISFKPLFSLPRDLQPSRFSVQYDNRTPKRSLLYTD